jgi:hypothetical protein
MRIKVLAVAAGLTSLSLTSNVLADNKWISDVSFKPTSIAAGMDGQNVADVLSSQREPLLDCYRRRGIVAISFTVNQDGSVAAVKAKGISKAVGVCVSKVIAGTKFSPVKASGAVSYKLSFNRKKELLQAKFIGALGVGEMGHGDGRINGELVGTSGPVSKAKGPQLQWTTPKVQGAYEPEILRRFLKRDQSKYVACYEKVLVDNPKFVGKLDVAFTITSSGLVTDVVATGFDKKATSCIVDVLSKLELPKPSGEPGGETYVSVAMTFSCKE